MQAKLDPQTWQKLFTDISPTELAQNGKSFPIDPYFNDVLESYEREVGQ